MGVDYYLIKYLSIRAKDGKEFCIYFSQDRHCFPHGLGDTSDTSDDSTEEDYMWNRFLETLRKEKDLYKSGKWCISSKSKIEYYTSLVEKEPRLNMSKVRSISKLTFGHLR